MNSRTRLYFKLDQGNNNSLFVSLVLERLDVANFQSTKPSVVKEVAPVPTCVEEIIDLVLGNLPTCRWKALGWIIDAMWPVKRKGMAVAIVTTPDDSMLPDLESLESQIPRDMTNDLEKAFGCMKNSKHPNTTGEFCQNFSSKLPADLARLLSGYWRARQNCSGLYVLPFQIFTQIWKQRRPVQYQKARSAWTILLSRICSCIVAIPLQEAVSDRVQVEYLL